MTQKTDDDSDRPTTVASMNIPEDAKQQKLLENTHRAAFVHQHHHQHHRAIQKVQGDSGLMGDTFRSAS